VYVSFMNAHNIQTSSKRKNMAEMFSCFVLSLQIKSVVLAAVSRAFLPVYVHSVLVFHNWDIRIRS
jgi:hypothetical protein